VLFRSPQESKHLLESYQTWERSMAVHVDSLLFHCLRALSVEICKKEVRLSDLPFIPTELRTKLLTYISHSALLNPTILADFLLPSYYLLNLPLCVQLDDRAMQSIALTCSQLHILNSYFSFFNSFFNSQLLYSFSL